jgi:hypothetical protein
MSIITSFGELYDKTLAPGFANYTTSNDAFEVKEHDPKASTTLLRVEQAGAIFASFNYMLVKGMGDITERRSSHFENHDCDGVTFKTYQGQDGLVFSELKSKFSTQKVYEAFLQMTHSFLKMHAMLSLCKDYTFDDMSLHFIAACQCFEDKDQEINIYNRLSKEEQISKTTFASKFLRKLIEHHDVTVKFGEVTAVWDLPINQNLADKEITLSLQVTRNFGDSSLVYVI